MQQKKINNDTQVKQEVPERVTLWICCHCQRPRTVGLTYCDGCHKRLHDTIEDSRVSAPSIAPVVDEDNEMVSRTQLLVALRGGMETCLVNANDQTKPEAYRAMMGHFAEAGRQVIEMIEERRYSGPISAHTCEGCGSPTVVVQVTDDDVALCPLCYAATPETSPTDRIQCPHCRWRPSASFRPSDGLYKCANCDFKWTVSVADVPASPVAPQEQSDDAYEVPTLTPAELADIERFQSRRRKRPVPEDAWLYVAEIDRLLAHVHSITSPTAPRGGAEPTQELLELARKVYVEVSGDDEGMQDIQTTAQACQVINGFLREVRTRCRESVTATAPPSTGTEAAAQEIIKYVGANISLLDASKMNAKKIERIIIEHCFSAGDK